MSQLDEDDLFDFADVEEAAPEEVRRRAKQPYKEATVRPKTRLEALAEADSDMFGESLVDVPNMRDVYPDIAGIHALQGTNGLKYIGSFNGAGGSSTGFAWAGWKALMWIEFVKAARETLHANYPSVLVEPEDVHAYVLEWRKNHRAELLETYRVAELALAPELTEDELQQRLAAYQTKLNTDQAGLVIKMYKPKKAKRVQHVETVNWEATLEAAAKSGDDTLLAAVEQLRYDVTFHLITSKLDGDKTVIWGDDIRSLDGQGILDAFGLQPGELDAWEGSPPCKSFSTAGLREQGWGEVMHYSDERDQRTDDLFIEYVRLLTAMRPKSFIAENVAGIGMGSAATDVMEPLLREFDSLGYYAEARLLNSKDFGVAQSRPRMFFQGISHALIDQTTGRGVRPKWPAPHPHIYTCQEALDAAGESTDLEVSFAWLGSRDALMERLASRPMPSEVDALWPKKDRAKGMVDKEVIADRPFPTDKERYETGAIWSKLGLGAAPENKAYQLVRCHPNLPVPTITATSAGNIPAAGPCHPHENRKFTINEYRWLFSFPHDYIFTGNIEQQGERMGRSVTPYIMKQLSEQLAAQVAKGTLVAEAVS